MYRVYGALRLGSKTLPYSLTAEHTDTRKHFLLITANPHVIASIIASDLRLPDGREGHYLQTLKKYSFEKSHQRTSV